MTNFEFNYFNCILFLCFAWYSYYYYSDILNIIVKCY